MMESGEVRKRLLHTIDRVRREAVAHRAEADRAREAFEVFLNETASPVFRQLSQALKAEGYPFQVSTPAGSVRLTSDRSGDDFIELSLDTERRPVAVVARIRRARGRHPVEHDLVVHEGADLAPLGDEQVLHFVLDQLAPFVER
jgi:murein DD-endopeptidase MepM/ murein hydrolase activator NlpD